jgi:hypothetical protein
MRPMDELTDGSGQRVARTAPPPDPSMAPLPR